MKLTSILLSPIIPNHGKSYYASPYDSTYGVPTIFGFIAIGILIYIIFRVWWSLRKEKNKPKIKSN